MVKNDSVFIRGLTKYIHVMNLIINVKYSIIDIIKNVVQVEITM